MKRKKGLLAVVAALAISTVMAAMAYSSSYVQNPTTLKVASTDSALLQINPGTGVGNKDEASYVKDGVMYVNFGKGIDGKNYGLQPGSGYTWDKLFSVTNNSKETLTYRFTVSNPELVKHLTITDNRDNKVSFGEDGKVYRYVTLASGETASFKVNIWLHQYTKLQDIEGTIQVNTFAQ